MQILAALLNMSALGSLFTEDNMSLKGIDLYKIDGILLPIMKIIEIYIFDIQELTKITKNIM